MYLKRLDENGCSTGISLQNRLEGQNGRLSDVQQTTKIGNNVNRRIEESAVAAAATLDRLAVLNSRLIPVIANDLYSIHQSPSNPVRSMVIAI